MQVELQVNGKRVKREVEEHTSRVEFLHQAQGLTAKGQR
jgi:aerobic-type carbon monoxide dehydrogenase small subunit (CoxS/CutS family)